MFKNSIAQRIKALPELESFNALLLANSNKKISDQQEQLFSWHPYGDEITKTVGDAIFFQLLIQKRLLPTSVINKALQEKVVALEEEQGRKLDKKERGVLKDEIIFDLMPKAFVQEKYVEAFIDAKEMLIVVNTSSARTAEDLLSFLRKTLGGLDCVPIQTKEPIGIPLTRWALHGSPAGVEMTGDYKIQSPEGERKAGLKGFSGDQETLDDILDCGGQVKQMSIKVGDLELKVSDDFSLKGIKDHFVDDNTYETIEEVIQADMLLTSSALVKTVNTLIGLFGGEVS